MKGQKRINKLTEVLREVGFYLMMLLILFSIFFAKNSSGGAPTSIGGFSIMQVLTGSMETEIPKGSLIITHWVSPDTLEVGDDITYMISSTTTITHRIVDVKEDYADTGERAFITQGVCNPNPDSEPVAAVNVVGKVIFHSYALGQIFGFVQEHWLFIAILLVLFMALLRAIKELVRVNRSIKQEERKEEPHDETETKNGVSEH